MPPAAVSGPQLVLPLAGGNPFLFDPDATAVTGGADLAPSRDRSSGPASVTPRHVWRKRNRCERCGLVRRVTCVGGIHARGLWYFREGLDATLVMPPCEG